MVGRRDKFGQWLVPCLACSQAPTTPSAQIVFTADGPARTGEALRSARLSISLPTARSDVLSMTPKALAYALSVTLRRRSPFATVTHWTASAYKVSHVGTGALRLRCEASATNANNKDVTRRAGRVSPGPYNNSGFSSETPMGGRRDRCWSAIGVVSAIGFCPSGPYNYTIACDGRTFFCSTHTRVARACDRCGVH